uniref:Uncharacterized protein n=1 Tax=Panagrolaimus sp. ES5 TaxID=591445 RepID=A0AC34GBA3_9BILA
MKVLPCPRGSRPLYRPDNQPRKCLPHQTNLCLNALDDKTDPSTVCCWHNQIDYHCCIGIDVAECPQYNNVTVVIHNSFSHLASPVKSFHFRKGIEDEIDFAQ